MSGRDRPEPRTPRGVDTSCQEWGSDHVADLLKRYGFEFVAFNPGYSFRGLEESIINYNNEVPSVVQTTHEGLAVSVAHGYAKATGEPAAVALHNVVGTLHGSMGLFNASIDRVPLVVLAGTGPLRKSARRPRFDWIHTALDQGSLVRDVVKFTDQPAHVDGTADSIARAYRVASTQPKGPAYVALDVGIQETPLDAPLDLPNPERTRAPTPPAADPAAIERAADMLVEAEFPVVVTDQVGDSRAAVDALVELAETLGTPVLSTPKRKYRYNFPNTHPMDFWESDAYQEADLVLALEVWSLDYTLLDVDGAHHESWNTMDGEYDVIDVGVGDLKTSSLVPDYSPVRETALSIVADTAHALPALVEAVTERLDAEADARQRAEERFASLAERNHEYKERRLETAEARWDETPVSLPRLAAELWDVIADESWVLVNGHLGGWEQHLWEIDEWDQYVGSYSGGGGIGYGIGAAIGGALAYADTDRVPINLQSDGDLMYYLGGLWTIGHYEIPMLTVMNNNRAFFNSTNHRMTLAEHRGRDASYERAQIGTGLWDPTPDYAAIAESMGVNGYGPIEDPEAVAPALRAGWADVRAGEPALVDVVCQST